MPAGRTRRKTFYGKYRGVVADNADPQGRGRLRLTVPDVLGAGVSLWAEACLPPLAGLAPAMPEIGAMLWVEFEAGDPDRPIWTGCLWPAAGDAARPASITLATLTGASLVIGTAGITLANGQGASVELRGPSVSLNHGALMVV